MGMLKHCIYTSLRLSVGICTIDPCKVVEDQERGKVNQAVPGSSTLHFAMVLQLGNMNRPWTTSIVSGVLCPGEPCAFKIWLFRPRTIAVGHDGLV